METLVDTGRGRELPEDSEPQRFEILKPTPYYSELETEEELQEKYLGLTADLIDKIAGNEDEPGYDVVVWLDKSTRPLELIVRESWDGLAPQVYDEETGSLKTVSRPVFKFANIDRLNWRKNPSLEMNEGGSKPITEEHTRALRSIYQIGKQNQLDHKRILVVDEQSESGDTLKIAKELFSQAFPDSSVDGYAWINHSSTEDKNGQKTYHVKEIPVWYPPKNSQGLHPEDGRGVGNPKPFNPANPAHGPRFPKEAYPFLSTPIYKEKTHFTTEQRLELAELRKKSESQELTEVERRNVEARVKSLTTERDPKSLQLREEIQRMVGRFASGYLFPRVATERETILGLPAREYNVAATEIRRMRSSGVSKKQIDQKIAEIRERIEVLHEKQDQT